MFYKNLEKINDIYFISNQIKKINKDFILFYNKISKLYEIHNFNYKPSLIISYSKYPDSGLIDKLYKTNKENMSRLFLEIEKENQTLETNKDTFLTDKATASLSEILNYLNSNPGKNLTPSQIKSILEKEV